MKLLGLDPGYAAFGMGLIDLDGSRPRVAHVSVVTTEANKEAATKAKDLGDRIAIIAKELRRLMGPDVLAICVEMRAIPYRKGKLMVQPSVVSGLGRARGLVDMLALEYGVPVVEVSPQSLKFKLTGDQGATKLDVQNALVGVFPELPQMWPQRIAEREHGADAVGAAWVGYHSDIVRAARMKLLTRRSA